MSSALGHENELLFTACLGCNGDLKLSTEELVESQRHVRDLYHLPVSLANLGTSLIEKFQGENHTFGA